MAKLNGEQKKCWEEAIQEEVDYIISRVKWEMKFANFRDGEEVLRLIPDWRFFRKDILDRLSVHPELESSGCYAKRLFEFQIVFYKK